MFALFVSARAPAAALPPGVERAPAPGFVRTLPLPAPRESRLRQVDGGSYDLLYDTQVRIDGGVETTYRRHIYKVVNRSGLEAAAQQQASFDPSYEKLVIHSVRILREGRAIDITDRIDVDSMRRERELDDGIVTGIRTVVMRMPDVRVGDLIDVSWSWISRPPLWPGHYFSTAQLGWSVPVEITHYSVDLPSAVPPEIMRYRGAPAARKSRRGGRTVYEWTSVDPQPVVDQEDTPAWFQPWQRISVSTMRRWSDVVNWSLPLYRAADEFPASLEPEAVRIDRAGGGPERKAISALRLVQDKIRYTSMSIGTGSYAPRSPAQVVRQRWGDCKDKAQLLVALLRRLKIEAWPALTDTKEGMALDRGPPAPLAFNHVVVQARINGRTYWLDPTIAHQGGTLATLAPLAYRKALPIRPGQIGLEDIPLPRPGGPTHDVTETYRLAPEGIYLSVDSRYTGDGADVSRSDFASHSIAGRETDYLHYYRKRLPGLKLAAPLVLRDDRDANRFETAERYFLPGAAYADGKLLDAFPVFASYTSSVYKYPDDSPRTQPLSLSYPIDRVHRIIFVTPGHAVGAPGDRTVHGKAFDFTLRSERDGDRLAIVFSLIGKRSLLAPEDFLQFTKDADRVVSSSEWTLAITKGRPVPKAVRIALAVLLTMLGLLFLAGLDHARRRKDDQKESETLYPVPMVKFVALGVATLGLYGSYWFWRNWRWVRKLGDRNIWPFWRAVFAIFWLYPLFAQANDRAKRKIPHLVGAAAALCYLLWSIGTPLYDRLSGGGLTRALSFLGLLFILPAVAAVNRANPTETVAANARMGWLAIATLFVGLPASILMLIAGY